MAAECRSTSHYRLFFWHEHINALIEDWIESRSGCVLEIVDPSTPKSRSDCKGSTSDFIRAALEYKNRESMGCPGYPGRWGSARPVFEFHRMKAAEWIDSHF